jgi:ComEC/Rec2-related protein
MRQGYINYIESLRSKEYFNLCLFIPFFIILGFVIAGVWFGDLAFYNHKVTHDDIKFKALKTFLYGRYFAMLLFSLAMLVFTAVISLRYALVFLLCICIGVASWVFNQRQVNARFLVHDYHNDVLFEARVLDILPRDGHLSVIAGDIKIIKDNSFKEAPNYRDDAHKDATYTKTLPWYKFKKQKSDIKTPVDESIQGMQKIMLSYYDKKDNTEISINDTIVVKAKIFSIPKRLYFSDYNYEQMLIYQGFNAMGQITEVVSKMQNPSFFTKLTTGLTKIRYSITQDIRSTIKESDIASIIDALITGKRTSLTKELNIQINRSGLSHILSISGMHIAIVASFFIVVCELFAVVLIPSFVLRCNIKKVSAITGIIGSFCYLAISGFLVPAARSFLMITLMLIAVMLGRRALTLRSLSIIASFIILFVPYTVFYASFQLSFIAVLSLIITFNNVDKKTFNSKIACVSYYFWNIILSSIITTLVTMFFVVYHFGVVSLSATLSNMIVIPLFTFFIMPLCVCYAILFFIGFGQGIFLHAIAIFVKGIIWTAKVFSSSKYFFIAMIGPSQLLVYSFYIAFICYGFFSSRHLKLVSITTCLGIFIYYLIFQAYKKPFFVTDGSNVMFYDDEYDEFFQNGKMKDEFLRSLWLQELAIYNAQVIERQNIYLNDLIFINSLYEDKIDIKAICNSKSIVVFARWVSLEEILEFKKQCKNIDPKKRFITNVDFLKAGSHAFFKEKNSDKINIITTYRYD